MVKQRMSVKDGTTETHLTLYKTATLVTTRKPKTSTDYLIFKVKCEDAKSISLAKQFVKGIIIDVNELNFLKNDICFLLEDLFGEDYSVSRTSLEKSSFFYVWVYLPYSSKNDKIDGQIYPFDVIHIKRNLSTSEISTIIGTLKMPNVRLHHRHLHEIPKIPLSICVLANEDNDLF